MKLADLTPTNVAVLAGVVGVAALGLWIWSKGGLANAAAAAGAGAVNAAGAAASGAVGAIGAGVGLPTPAQTTTEASVARWIIDHPLGGYFEASKWAGAPALLKASLMPAGSGTPPPAGSDLARRFPVLPEASYDETDRLANRYPSASPMPIDYGGVVNGGVLF